MKIVINAVLAPCILCYSQQFLQLMLELLLLYSNYLFSLVLKKNDISRVELGTRTQTKKITKRLAFITLVM